MKLIVYKNELLNHIIKILLYLLIFLLPYDSIKYMSTSYRPLSLFPLIALFVLLIPKIIKIKFYREKKYYLVFYFFSCASSFFLCIIRNYKISFAFDFFITNTLGFLLFFILDILFKSYSGGRFTLKIVCLISYAYLVPVFITLLDMLSIYGLLPSNVSSSIHMLFGGGQSVRICGTTGEASWVCIHMLFALFSYYYLYSMKIKKYRNLFMMLLCLIIVIFSFSMLGYIAIVLFLCVIWLKSITKRITFKNVALLILALIFGIVFINIVSNLEYDIYFIVRFKNLSLKHLIHTDASVFTRLINPTVAIIMGFKNPFLGIGGGLFPIYYGEYIRAYFSFGLDIYGGVSEITTGIYELTANAKCLYARIIAENGLISIFYFMFLYVIYKKSKSDKIVNLWLVMLLILMLQFDSLCYFPFVFLLAFANNVGRSDVNDCNYSC